MKKILFIVTHSEYGGAQRFLHTLSTNLKKEEFDISVAFGFGDKDNTASIDYLGGKLRDLGIKTYELRNLVRSPRLVADIKAVAEIRKLVKTLTPDVLFLGSSKAGFVGSLATVFPSKIANIRVIYRIGGWTFNDPWSRWKRLMWIAMERVSARWKDIIIVNSKKDYDDARKYKINPKEACVLIHNGIDAFDESLLLKEEARVRLLGKIKNNGKLLTSKMVVGTIANFYETKGVEYLIRAAEQLKNEDIVFALIGDGPLRPKLENLIKELELNGKVFITGQIPDASMYLRAFDIYVQPSLKEGFPWALLEAMTAKLPVIATPVGAVTEMIDDGKNGFLVEPKNSEQIADAILKLVHDDHKRQEFGIQANQKVHFNFDLDTMINKVKALL